MIIKKTFQGAVPDSKIFNTNSSSKVDTYSCDKINRLIGSSGGGSATNYSTEEQIVGTWVDGKPIYMKTVVFENTSNLTKMDIEHGIQDLDEIIDVRGSFCSYTSWKPLTVLYTPQMSDYNMSVYAIEAKGTFTVLVGKMLASEKGFTKANITFYYTKTTD
jgi:hypothetical protein